MATMFLCRRYPVPRLSKMSAHIATALLLGLTVLQYPGATWTSVIVSPTGAIHILPTLVYTERVKVVINFPLPAVPDEHNTSVPESVCNDPSSPSCALRNQTLVLQKAVTDYIATVPNAPGHSRKRRSSGFLGFAKKVGGLLWNGIPRIIDLLTDPEHTVTRQQEEEPAVHLPVAIPQSNPVRAIQKVGSALSHAGWIPNDHGQAKPMDPRIYVQATRTLGDVTHLMTVFTEYSLYAMALQSCDINRLPRTLFPPCTLKPVLTEAQKNISKLGMDMVIPISDMDLYFHIPGVTCTSQNGQFSVTLGIPVKRPQTHSVLLEVAPIPFRVSHNTVCTYFKDTIRLALVDNSLFVLDREFCLDELTCDLSRDRNTEALPTCLAPLFPNEALHRSKCEPICESDHLTSGPILFQTSHASFFVATSDTHPLTVKCASGLSTQLTHEQVGAVHVSNFPSDCAVLSDNIELLTQNLLTTTLSINTTFKVEKVVPFTWLKTPPPVFATFLKGPYSVQESVILNELEIAQAVEKPSLLASLTTGERIIFYGSPVHACVCFISCITVTIWCVCKRTKKAGRPVVTNDQTESAVSAPMSNIPRRQVRPSRSPPEPPRPHHFGHRSAPETVREVPPRNYLQPWRQGPTSNRSPPPLELQYLNNAELSGQRPPNAQNIRPRSYPSASGAPPAASIAGSDESRVY